MRRYLILAILLLFTISARALDLPAWCGVNTLCDASGRLVRVKHDAPAAVCVSCHATNRNTPRIPEQTERPEEVPERNAVEVHPTGECLGVTCFCDGESFGWNGTVINGNPGNASVTDWWDEVWDSDAAAGREAAQVATRLDGPIYVPRGEKE